MTSGAHRFEGGGERQASGGDESPVLAKAVAHHHVGRDAVLAQQTGEGDVDRQHRWLGDLGAAQLLLGVRHLLWRCRIDEDHVGQRPTQQWCHHHVGLGEGRGDRRLVCPQPGQHVDVLRTLAGVEEGNLAGHAVAAEDATALEHLPRQATLRQRIERLCRLVGQFGGVAVVDCDALDCGQRIGARRLWRWCSAGGGLGLNGAQLLAESGLGCGAEQQRSTQRCLGDGGLHLARGEIGADGEGAGAVGGQPTWHVLLQHRVEVGAPEAERAHGRAAHLSGRHLPVGQLRVHMERRSGPIDVWVGFMEAEAGRDLLGVQGQRGFE